MARWWVGRGSGEGPRRTRRRDGIARRERPQCAGGIRIPRAITRSPASATAGLSRLACVCERSSRGVIGRTSRSMGAQHRQVPETAASPGGTGLSMRSESTARTGQSGIGETGGPPEDHPIFEVAILSSSLELGGRANTSRHCRSCSTCSAASTTTARTSQTSVRLNHTIFEGTSEIQQLVIAQAISGLRIE